MTYSRGRGPGREYKLQFGHSVAAVDDEGRRRREEDGRSGFNSATASPPWMTTRNSLANPRATSLQFGHSVAAVDDFANEFRVVYLARLQFGHSVAAVDDLQDVGRRGEREVPLQFGHSVAAVDDGVTYVAQLVSRKLQFGHSVAAVDDNEPGVGDRPKRYASIRPQRRRRG